MMQLLKMRKKNMTKYFQIRIKSQILFEISLFKSKIQFGRNVLKIQDREKIYPKSGTTNQAPPSTSQPPSASLVKVIKCRFKVSPKIFSMCALQC